MATLTQTQVIPPFGTLHIKETDQAEQEANVKAATPAAKLVRVAPGPDYKYAKFLPSYDQSLKLPPLVPFEHVDPGKAALNDPEPRSFLNDAVEDHLTPKFGSVISGVQLSQLGAREKR